MLDCDTAARRWIKVDRRRVFASFWLLSDGKRKKNERDRLKIPMTGPTATRPLTIHFSIYLVDFSFFFVG